MTFLIPRWQSSVSRRGKASPPLEAWRPPRAHAPPRVGEGRRSAAASLDHHHHQASPSGCRQTKTGVVKLQHAVVACKDGPAGAASTWSACLILLISVSSPFLHGSGPGHTHNAVWPSATTPSRSEAENGQKQTKKKEVTRKHEPQGLFGNQLLEISLPHTQ